MEESLRYNTTELTDQLRRYEAQPSIEDFDFLRSEVAQLQADMDVDRRELEFLREENRKVRESNQAHERRLPLSAADGRPPPLRTVPANVMSRPAAYTCRGTGCVDGENEGSGHESEDTRTLDEDILKMTMKLKSLEKFAHRFMPATTHGVPEFHHTVEKSKARMKDIEERLATRMRLREC